MMGKMCTPFPLIHSMKPVIMKDLAGDHASSFAFLSFSCTWSIRFFSMRDS